MLWTSLASNEDASATEAEEAGHSAASAILKSKAMRGDICLQNVKQLELNNSRETKAANRASKQALNQATRSGQKVRSEGQFTKTG